MMGRLGTGFCCQCVGKDGMRCANALAGGEGDPAERCQRLAGAAAGWQPPTWPACLPASCTVLPPMPQASSLSKSQKKKAKKKAAKAAAEAADGEEGQPAAVAAAAAEGGSGSPAAADGEAGDESEGEEEEGGEGGAAEGAKKKKKKRCEAGWGVCAGRTGWGARLGGGRRYAAVGPARMVQLLCTLH